MFVIITYDVDEKIGSKVHKTLKKYLVWSQNSVFEGDIPKGKLKKCLSELKKYIVEDRDSLYVYQIQNPNHIEKMTLGHQKKEEGIFI